jgi:hypothetical protein
MLPNRPRKSDICRTFHDIAARQPRLLRPGLGKLIPIGTPAVLDGSATVDLTWDGTIDGQLAPAASCTMIAVRADPADPTVPDVCNRHSDEPHLSPNGLPTYDYGSSFSIGASFVVAE